MGRTGYVVADAGLAVEVANMIQCFLPLLFAEDLITESQNGRSRNGPL